MSICFILARTSIVYSAQKLLARFSIKICAILDYINASHTILSQSVHIKQICFNYVRFSTTSTLVSMHLSYWNMREICASVRCQTVKKVSKINGFKHFCSVFCGTFWCRDCNHSHLRSSRRDTFSLILLIAFSIHFHSLLSYFFYSFPAFSYSISHTSHSFFLYQVYINFYASRMLSSSILASIIFINLSECFFFWLLIFFSFFSPARLGFAFIF